MLILLSTTAGWATEPVTTGYQVVAPPGQAIGRTAPGVIPVQSGKSGVVTPHHRRIPRHPQPAVDNQHNFGPSYPFGYNYKGPSYPFGNNYTAPSYPFGNRYYSPPPPVQVAPVRPAPRWVHGYWGQQWVPQYYTYNAWVPGYFARNGAWVQGYYEPRAAESGGYYERVWVDGYWAE